ncbi:MAG: hypothetical protein GY845_09415 [Planctomycetes bacterium]|nr:hypothetical protein [Planctomycetota bacterium]
MSGDNAVSPVMSLNRSYLHLLATAARNGFKAIVADDGTGHYESISAAVTAGEKYIFIKNGAYSESSDMTLEGVSIIGQSAQGVVLTLTDATIIFADNDNSTTAGTSRPTNNDKSIVGAGTTYTTVTGDENKYIFADSWLAEIESVSDATNMELFTKYMGASQDQDGANYALAHQTFSNPSVGVSIENLTILHVLTGADNCIELQGVRNRISNVQFKNSNNSSTFIVAARSAAEIAVYTKIEKCRFEGGAVGIKLFSSKYTTIDSCNFFGCNDNCIELTANALGTIISKSSFTGCVRGINLTGAAQTTYVDKCFFSYTSFEAILIDLGGVSVRLYVTKCFFSQCYPGSRTIWIDADDMLFDGNTFVAGTNIIYVDSAENITISNNYFFEWQTRAIDFNSAQNQLKFTITGNHFIAESGGAVTEAGLDLWGTQHVVSHNTFANIEEEAVLFNCHRSVFSNNAFVNCGVSNLHAVGSYNSYTGNTFEDSTDAVVITGHESVFTSNVIKDDLATALLVSTGDRNIISGNRIENAVTNGMQVDVNSDRCVITSNITLNAGGINLVNNGTNTSVGNNIVA